LTGRGPLSVCVLRPGGPLTTGTSRLAAPSEVAAAGRSGDGPSPPYRGAEAYVRPVLRRAVVVLWWCRGGRPAAAPDHRHREPTRSCLTCSPWGCAPSRGPRRASRSTTRR